MSDEHKDEKLQLLETLLTALKVPAHADPQEWAEALVAHADKAAEGPNGGVTFGSVDTSKRIIELRRVPAPVPDGDGWFYSVAGPELVVDNRVRRFQNGLGTEFEPRLRDLTWEQHPFKPTKVLRCPTAEAWAEALLQRAGLLDAGDSMSHDLFPFDLVQLSTFPRETWIGRAVMCPGSQVGDTPHWLAEDCPFYQPDEEPGPAYDVGIVVSWETETFRGEPDNPAAHEVTFLTGMGGSLHYGAYNLWVPVPRETKV